MPIAAQLGEMLCSNNGPGVEVGRDVRLKTVGDGVIVLGKGVTEGEKGDGKTEGDGVA